MKVGRAWEQGAKIFRMNRLGIPQDRIAKRLGVNQASLHYHLSKMAKLPNSTNADLSRGLTVSHVTEKHGWTEPMVWSLAFEGREDAEKILNDSRSLAGD